ncbi:synaptogyrin-1a [Centropristis striata]|uniref:synaptogyrin-1a n=1 Tax=Centropristis striata TaxID=184440 RepID=UPI0027DEB4C7|nr:synaptogyrin-1a [Centropristis striata]
MDGFQAYGAGKAGGAFDPLTFIRQPQTAVRITCWLFSVVVLGCVSNEGYINRPAEVEEFCIFNRNPVACSYAVAVATLCFLCSTAFLALDIYFPQISSVKDRKKAVMADIVVSGLWCPVWFVGFCFLANQWQVSKEEDNPLNEGADAARAVIVFSFFSIFTWGGLTLLSLERLKRVSFEEEYNKLFSPPLVLQCLLAVYRFRLGSDSVTLSPDYVDPDQQDALEEAPPTDE